MKIETKLNVGEIGYTVKDSYLMAIEVLSIHLEISNMSMKLIYKCVDVSDGDRMEFDVLESKLFNTKQEFKSHLCNWVDKLENKHLSITTEEI